MRRPLSLSLFVFLFFFFGLILLLLLLFILLRASRSCPRPTLGRLSAWTATTATACCAFSARPTFPAGACSTCALLRCCPGCLAVSPFHHIGSLILPSSLTFSPPPLFFSLPPSFFVLLPCSEKTDVVCGVELELPLGRNDGMVRGVRYFTCADSHGVVCSPDKVPSIIPLRPFSLVLSMFSPPQYLIPNSRYRFADSNSPVSCCFSPLQSAVLRCAWCRTRRGRWAPRPWRSRSLSATTCSAFWMTPTRAA